VRTKIFTWCFIALALVSMVIGYRYSTQLKQGISQKPEKTSAMIEKSVGVVTPDTRIIYEKEYQECGHTVVSGYSQRDKLMGLDSRGLNDYFKKSQGYSVSLVDNIMVIHQTISNKCPEEQNEFKIKEYRGYIAVYTGAEENEILLRVTSIRAEMLPENIQRDIRAGKYSFQDEAKLNDTLENLDEYQ